MGKDNGAFDPILGHIGNAGYRRSGKFLGRILAASTRAGPKAKRTARSFTGSRIGRGAPIGRLLASRGGGAARVVRRATVIVAAPRIAGRGAAAAGRHLRYIQRDGVSREGGPGELYSAREGCANGKEFLERSTDDRHQFRVILSADEGDLYDDLKPLVRRFMDQIEKDLHTELDWVAADHFNTGKPHSHIIIRGIDDRGGDLIIAREYLKAGMQERASEIVALDLGPKSQLEIAARARLDVGQRRVTEIDRDIFRDVEAGKAVSAAASSSFEQARRAGRLQMLKRFGLAEEVSPGRWHIEPDFHRTLAIMAARSDVVERLQHDLVRRGKSGLTRDYVLHDDAAPLDEALIGRIALHGRLDEHRHQHFFVLDAIDGRQHCIAFDSDDRMASLSENVILRLTPAEPGEREIGVEILSPVPLHRLVDAEAVTWLDKQYAAGMPMMCRDRAFGSEVLDAMERRRQWLVEHGWAEIGPEGLVYRDDAFAELSRRELTRLATALSTELGTYHSALAPLDRFAGIVGRKLSSEGGQYIIVENAFQFSLVPWSSELEASIGRTIEGIVREDGIGWALKRGLDRESPAIS